MYFNYVFIISVTIIAFGALYLRYVCPSVHPSARYNSVPTDRIFMILDI
jgi:hypothetical protein